MSCELAVSPTCPNINNKRALEVNDTNNQGDRNNLQQQLQQGGASGAPSADAAAAVVVVSKRRRGGGGGGGAASAARCFGQQAAAAPTPSYAAGPTTLSALCALFPEMAQQVRRMLCFFSPFRFFPHRCCCLIFLRFFLKTSRETPHLASPTHPNDRTSPTCSTRAVTTSTLPCADSPSSA